jgi:hypothetical protein
MRLPHRINPNPMLRSEEDLQMRKNSAIQEYAEWNTRWHAANQNYQELSRLKAMFIGLKALDRIDISFKASPFKSNLLLSAWTQGNSSKDFKRRVKQFMNLLLALQGTSFQLNHLTHDKLPVTFCTLRDNVLRKLIGPLQHLSTIRLIFDAATVPHPRFWNGLGQVLQSIPNLTALRLGFAPFECGI